VDVKCDNCGGRGILFDKGIGDFPCYKCEAGKIKEEKMANMKYSVNVVRRSEPLSEERLECRKAIRKIEEHVEAEDARVEEMTEVRDMGSDLEQKVGDTVLCENCNGSTRIDFGRAICETCEGGGRMVVTPLGLIPERVAKQAEEGARGAIYSLMEGIRLYTKQHEADESWTKEGFLFDVHEWMTDDPRRMWRESSRHFVNVGRVLGVISERLLAGDKTGVKRNILSLVCTLRVWYEDMDQEQNMWRNEE
jgi:ribosomal protein S27E